ncbi:glycoside hydrolase family 3 N-terminal domain-containing protein [Lentilactobacillus sp. SPB1-3]|uniref:Glycoside hydrolase family 3 N-terminal domain-containing protein n=1 Tax=Lentilactobacillus terminaliae TaxID=3003483 RepID=A0ACD5DFB5_9LACO|nr:glycoside hydrolase family 3 N-terminal domain-containing protein [Lentilactobacillus sp. SPB1-3]MCZ0976600.1 beta-N-acetylhexosaminidase [Lentilactobacillus sp. SPB1-3]
MNFKKIIPLILIGILAGCAANKPAQAPTKKVAKAPVILTTKQKIAKQVGKMSLDEKIGQLFVTEVSNDSQRVKKDIQRYHFGGILLMGNNFVGNRQTFKHRLSSYQKSASLPLLIATDQEGGTVSRLSDNPHISGHSNYLSPQAAFNRGGMKAVLSNYRHQADNLKNLGINWNLAPVADVSKQPDNFIYDRTLGKGYQATAKYISASVKAIQDRKIATSVKHFPGYGAAADTHTGTATVNKSLAEFKRTDFVPFEAAIKAGADSIMVTHIILNKVDPRRPASLSKKDISILRNDLKYSGVIASDSLQMGAVSDYANKYHISRDVVAFEAGNDILLSNDYQNGISEIKRAVKQNKISMNQLDRSVERILYMKHKIGLKIS